jgi:hypothetical protein
VRLLLSLFLLTFPLYSAATRHVLTDRTVNVSEYWNQFDEASIYHEHCLTDGMVARAVMFFRRLCMGNEGRRRTQPCLREPRSSESQNRYATVPEVQNWLGNVDEPDSIDICLDTWPVSPREPGWKRDAESPYMRKRYV